MVVIKNTYDLLEGNNCIILITMANPTSYPIWAEKKVFPETN